MIYQQQARFPDGFLWGRPLQPIRLRARGMKTVRDRRWSICSSHPPGTADFRIASDHYHRVEEDVALMAQMGLKAYRFSVAWSRVIPDGDGPVNPGGLAFYHRLIDALTRHEDHPIVTLYHFDLPWALELKRRLAEPAKPGGIRALCPAAVQRICRQSSALADD